MGSIIFTIVGLLLILFFFGKTLNENRIKRNGILTTAKVISISIEDGIKDEHGRASKLKIPIYKFEHINKNGDSKVFRVKGKSNSRAKIGENTPVYFNPDKPEKEYYLPKKDFLIKYVLLLMGFVFFSIGVLMNFNIYKKYFNHLGINITEKEDFFLFVLITFFSVTAILFLIGLISNKMENNKAGNTGNRCTSL